MMRQAREAGLGVVAWTVNDPGDIRRMIALGVDGIMSDWPERVAQAPGER
jgi:glycerophosphoryl diester phosphodiesterase